MSKKKKDIKYVSYAITACNELDELNTLLNVIAFNKRTKDEIVILLDESNYTSEVEDLIKAKKKGNNLKYFKYPLNKNFSEFKNKLNEHCTKDYIFQIDADEYPSRFLIKKFIPFLGDNDVDLFYIPRLNVISDMSEDFMSYVNEMNWRVEKHPTFKRVLHKDGKDSDFYNFIKKHNFIITDDKFGIQYYVPIINFPDYQARLYKNDPSIKWNGKVHETISGHTNYYQLPVKEIDYCLIHQKSSEKQKKQNNFYSTI